MITRFFRRFFIFKYYLVLAIIGIGVLTFFAKQHAFFSFDLYITKLIQQINLPLFGKLMTFISFIGNFYPVIFSLTAGCLSFLYFKKNNLAFGILVSALGAVTISETFKLIVARPRPDPSLINQIEKFARDDSFPSGHVLYYIGFYGFLLFAVYTQFKFRKWRRVISGLLITFIVLVGVSRIYLGSHWFSDILASYLIGSVWLYLAVLIFRKIEVQSLKNGKQPA